MRHNWDHCDQWTSVNFPIVNLDGQPADVTKFATAVAGTQRFMERQADRRWVAAGLVLIVITSFCATVIQRYRRHALPINKRCYSALFFIDKIDLAVYHSGDTLARFIQRDCNVLTKFKPNYFYTNSRFQRSNIPSSLSLKRATRQEYLITL